MEINDTKIEENNEEISKLYEMSKMRQSII